MKAAIVIIAVVAFVALRLYRRSRRGQPRRAASGGERVRGDVELVIRREVHERIVTCAFRISTIVVLLGIAAAIVIPVISKGHPTTVRIGVVGQVTASLRATAAVAAHENAAKDRVESEPSLAAGERVLTAGRVDLLVDGLAKIVTERAITAWDNSAAASVAETLAVSLGLEAEPRIGIPPADAARLSHPGALPLVGLKIEPQAHKEPHCGERERDLHPHPYLRPHHPIRHLGPARHRRGEVEPHCRGPPRRDDPASAVDRQSEWHRPPR